MCLSSKCLVEPDLVLLYLRMSISETGHLEFFTEFNDMTPKQWHDVTDNQYDGFKWHKVRFERNTTTFRLILDGKLKAELTTSSQKLSSNLQLGGFPESRSQTMGNIADLNAFRLYFTRYIYRVRYILE